MELSRSFKIDEDTTGLRLHQAAVKGKRITFECWISGHRIVLEGTGKKDALKEDPQGDFEFTQATFKYRRYDYGKSRKSKVQNPVVLRHDYPLHDDCSPRMGARPE